MGLPLFKGGAIQIPEIDISTGFDLLFDVNADLEVPAQISAGFDLIFDVDADITASLSVSAGFDLVFDVDLDILNGSPGISAGFDLLFDVAAWLSAANSLSAGFNLLFDVSGVLSVPAVPPPEYSCLAVQGVVGGAGRKATTLIPAYSFNSLGSINGVPIGLNSSGLHRLFDGETADGVEYTRSFILKKHHLGYPGNLKKLRYLYIACSGNIHKMTVSVRPDDYEWTECGRYTPWAGGFRVAASSRQQGIYWSVRISSEEEFSIDGISVLFIARSSGISYR